MIRLVSIAALAGIWVALSPASGLAYLRGARFMASAIDGGGGGRFFTGSPRDGYTCAVCHSDEPDRGPPTLLGVPDGNYVPGERYELELMLPEGEAASAVIEVTDGEGDGVGLIELEGADALVPCTGAEEPPARVVMAPTGRSVAVVDACDVPAVRVVWTAPASDPPSVWLNVVVVVGDGSVDLGGDTVYPLRRLVRPVGGPLAGAAIEGTCSAGLGSGGSAYALILAALVCVLGRRIRRGS